MGCSRGWTGATIVLAATALAAGAVTPAAAANECANTDYSCLTSSALRNTNAVRAKHGKPALTLGPASLLTNTVGHSKKLADNAGRTDEDLVHQPFADIYAAVNCGNVFFNAENLGMYAPCPDNGDVTAQSITNLENSPLHLKNILSDCDFVTTGLYIDSKKGVWVTQVFGSWTDTTTEQKCSAMNVGETNYGGGNDGGNSGEEAAVPTPAYPAAVPSSSDVEPQPSDPVETPIYTPAPSATVLPLGALCNSDMQCDAATGAYCRAGWETGAEGGVRARCRTFAAPCATCSSDTMACWEGYECTPDDAGAGTCKAVGDTEGRVNCDAPSDSEYIGDDGRGDAGSGDNGSIDSGSGDGGSNYYRPGVDTYNSVPSVYGPRVAPDTYGSVSFFRRNRRSRTRVYYVGAKLARAAPSK
ncbi:hypothetical protein MMPV_003185 [Pyropia vietnamensis]